MPYLQNALAHIIETLGSLFLLIAVLRFLFQLVQISPKNQVAQIVITITNPVLRPLQRVIPGLHGFDLTPLILILLLGVIKLYGLTIITGTVLPIHIVLVYVLREVLNMVFWILIIAIFIRVLLSWIPGLPYHPAMQVVENLSDPILAPFRRLIPTLGGLDISPIFAILALQLMRDLIFTLLSYLFTL